MSLRLQCYASEVWYLTDLPWRAQLRFPQERPQLAEVAAPAFQNFEIADAGRDWTGTTQITFNFSEAMTADATGWSLTVNGVSKTLTYVSGSGTQNVIFRVGAVLHHGDTLKISYDTVTGGTNSVTGSLEIKGLTAIPQNDQLTKRVRFVLCDSTDAPVANEVVKSALLEYDSGVVANSLWGTLANKQSVTTDGSGNFDALYTGSVAVGGTAYCAIFRATESLAVAATVV